MSQADTNRRIDQFPPLRRWPALVVLALIGFLLGIFGTYWDDAWHTDKGRDAFLIAPHIALYLGISLAGGALSLWGLLGVRKTSRRAALAHPPLLLALLGVAITLLAAPIDNAWHLAFGRDAVIWSPPHMLGVAGSLAIAAGLLLELAPARHKQEPPRALVGWIAAAAVLAVGAIPVLEYETDVPQFDLLLYLPILTTGAAFAFGLIRLVVPGAWPATTAALAYTSVMALIAVVLLAADMPAPLVPLLVAPALILDWSSRRCLPTWAAAVLFAGSVYLVYVPYLNWLKSDLFIDGQDVLLGLPLAAVGAALSLWFTRAPGARPGRGGAVFGTAAVWLLLLPAVGLAHDPGQGDELATASVQATVDGDAASLEVEPNDPSLCPELEPTGMVARRAGEIVRAPLERLEPCQFAGRVTLSERGRWFVYAVFAYGQDEVETWLPVHTEASEPVADQARSLYLPPEVSDPPVKKLAGVAVYSLLAITVIAIPALYRRHRPR